MTGRANYTYDRQHGYPEQRRSEKYHWEYRCDRAYWRSGLPYRADRNWSAEGWPLLADDLWRIAHGDRSGAKRADAKIIGLGLGTALVLEQLIAGQLVLDNAGRVCLIDAAREAINVNSSAAAIRGHGPLHRAGLLPDDIADYLMLAIWREPEPLPLTECAAYAAQDADDRIRDRLIKAEHLVEEPRRFGRPPAYRPTDGNIAGWPAVRLLGPLTSRDDPLAPLDLVLLGLCRATGLHRWVFAASQEDPRSVDVICDMPDLLPDPFPWIFRQLAEVVKDSAGRLR